MSAEFVKCRYKHCDKLHSDTKIKKEEAVQGGVNFYYHPDCLHTKNTIEEIRDLFIKYVDPTLNGKQIGMLVKVINDIVFVKKINVDYLKFCLGYYIKYKPGVLKHPGGLHYIFNQEDIKSAWNKYNEYKIKQEIKAEAEKIKQEDIMNSTSDFDLPVVNNYKATKKSKFSNVLMG